MRRILSEAAHAAVKKKGSHFKAYSADSAEAEVQRGHLGSLTPLGAADLEESPRRDQLFEQGQETNPRAKKRRAQKLAQALRKLGYSVTLTEINPGPVPEASV